MPGLIRPHQTKLNIVNRVVDGSIVLGSFFLSVKVSPFAWDADHLTLGLFGLTFYFLFAERLQLYRSWRGAPFKHLVLPVILCWALTALSVLAVAYAIHMSSRLTRLETSFWILSVPVALIIWRLVTREMLATMRAWGFNSRTVAFAGNNAEAAELASYISSNPYLGMRVVGFYDDEAGQAESGRSADRFPLTGDLQKLLQQARSGGIDHVYITMPMTHEDEIKRLVAALADSTASVYLVPSFFTSGLFRSRWLHLGHIPTISIFDNPFLGLDGWMKRIEDIILAALILLVVWIPMVLIAFAVRLSSPGPILFKQLRYGLNGRPISVWKFRTMTVCEDGDQVVQACRGDPRVTPFGAFLRRTSLDELPQLFNVLRGEMSIVGPRPHAVSHNELYRRVITGYMLRHKVKPGITGWAQVNGWRGETDTFEKMQKRVDCDLWYIRNWSLWLDMKIVLRTMLTGFTGQNAF